MHVYLTNVYCIQNKILVMLPNMVYKYFVVKIFCLVALFLCTYIHTYNKIPFNTVALHA